MANRYLTVLEARAVAHTRSWSGLSMETVFRRLGREEHTFHLHADDRVTHYWTTPDGKAHVRTFKAGSPDAHWHWRQAQALTPAERRLRASIAA